MGCIDADGNLRTLEVAELISRFLLGCMCEAYFSEAVVFKIPLRVLVEQRNSEDDICVSMAHTLNSVNNSKMTYILKINCSIVFLFLECLCNIECV